MYDVSSNFLYTSALKNAPWKRRFLIGGSDYTNFVTKWPAVTKAWDSLTPQTVTIELSNEARTFNFYAGDPTKMQAVHTVQLGFTFTGSEEFLTMFSGTVDGARFMDGGCNLTLIDKFKRLADRKVGDSTSATAYTSSNYLIHDMAWYACTSHGGLSAIANNSNPDIDYDSFTSWSTVFSADNVRCNANLTGQTPLEMLRKLSMLTQSAIYIENNKIKFARFTNVGSVTRTVNDATVMDSQATLDDRQLVNRAWVSAAYNVNSRTFGITVYNQDSGSQAAYGLREQLTAETILWLTDSVSALNLAQRTIITKRAVQNRYSVRSSLQALVATIGDAVAFQDSLLQVDNTFRVMSETTDLDSGIKTLNIDQSQYFNAFTLDISALDSSDILT